jgi:hypothetical protein
MHTARIGSKLHGVLSSGIAEYLLFYALGYFEAAKIVLTYQISLSKNCVVRIPPVNYTRAHA